MQFTKEISVAAGGTEAAATWSTMKLSAGVIHQIDIMFPPGCVGLVHVAGYIGSHPIFPSTEGMVYVGNAEVISFKEYYKIENEETVLSIKTWNEDDTYDHIVVVRIYILPEWAVLPAGAAEGIIQSLRSIFVRPRWS